MQDLIERLKQAAIQIRTLEDSREKLGLFLREAKDKVEFVDDVLEKVMIYPVKKAELEGKKIVGVDGGLSKHSYHGLDLILTRAVAAVFEYGKTLSVKYYPHSLATPKLILLSDPYSDEEFLVSSSLERQRQEILVATEVAQKFLPDIIFMDGSIVPHGASKPSPNSLAWQKYEKISRDFVKLFSSAKLLAGCVEDSRGRRFCEIISRQVLSGINDPVAQDLVKVLEGTRDTNLLYHLLKKGERTFVFRYSRDPSSHPILSDLGEWAGRIYSFYIKTAEFDRPVRIDFVSKDPIGDAEKIASLVLATACHSSYGIPVPIIEADLRAKLKDREADDLHKQLIDRLGITPSLMRLRRDQRPF